MACRQQPLEEMIGLLFITKTFCFKTTAPDMKLKASMEHVISREISSPWVRQVKFGLGLRPLQQSVRRKPASCQFVLRSSRKGKAMMQ